MNVQQSAKDALIPLTLRYDRTYNERKPHRVFHNWGKSETQDAVAGHLAEELGLELIIADEQVAHARHLQLAFKDGREADIYLDQGFGQWGFTVQFSCGSRQSNSKFSCFQWRRAKHHMLLIRIVARAIQFSRYIVQIYRIIIF